MGFKYKCNCKFIRILPTNDRTSEHCQWCNQALALVGATEPTIAPFVQIPKHHQAAPNKNKY